MRGLHGLCVRRSFFLCLPHREVWQFFQQLHNQVLLHVLVNGHLVDHGDVVFDHLLFGPLLTGNSGLDGSCVQQHFLLGHRVNSCRYLSYSSISQNRQENQHRKDFSTHFKSRSGGYLINHFATPPTTAEKP